MKNKLLVTTLVSLLAVSYGAVASTVQPAPKGDGVVAKLASLKAPVADLNKAEQPKQPNGQDQLNSTAPMAKLTAATDAQPADNTMPLTKIKPQDEANPGGDLAANDQSTNDDGTVLADQTDQNHYDDLYNSANQADSANTQTS